MNRLHLKKETESISETSAFIILREELTFTVFMNRSLVQYLELGDMNNGTIEDCA
jgi:hypothetical protein